jgi:predicted membrane-bound spermidine synthase
LFFGALSSLSLIVWWIVCHRTGFDRIIPLEPRIPILTFLFCMPPALVLSLLTPLTIKLMLPDVTKAGRIAGLVFALSTLGCLLGNYVTGFWLMADYTLNTITIGVAGGLALLAAPMLWVNFRIESGAIGPQTPPPNPLPETGRGNQTGDDPMGFKKDIRRAFVVVFLASFCGMSLELTGFRVLAPILGVSLFTWTGIIGVMLAGTACGNYLGGVLADRGTKVALERFALLIGTAVGFAGGPAFVRTFRLDEWPNEGTPALWALRVFGAAAGFGIVFWRVRASAERRGQINNLFALGAAIGFALAHPIARSLGQIVGIDDVGRRFATVNIRLGWDIGAMVIHLAGAAIGGAISLGLGYDPPSAKKVAVRSSPLSVCLFTGSLFTGLIVLMSHFFQKGEVGIYWRLTSEDIVWTVLTWTFILFFVPMFCLGTISPQVIRLSIPDTAHAGRVSGTVYAWSTAGAIAGTFVTGYLLIDWLGTARVLFVLSLGLMGMAFVVGKLWKNTPLLYVGSMVFAAGVMGILFFGSWSGGFTMESKYYAIRVRDGHYTEGEEKIPIKALDLDHLMHSFIKQPPDPTWLGYKHEYVQGELTRFARSRGPTEVLVIGGGGYTFPRWVEVKLSDVGVDVVEIDPAVTEVAYREMGLPRDTRIRSFNMDGRQFIRERAKKSHYSLVIQDAVNDLSVPYHLLTKEYNDAVKQTLAPGGAYLLTLIDSVEHGELWRAAVHTMRETFPHVVLLDPSGFKSPGDRSVFIVAGSDQPLEIAEIRAVAEEANLRDGSEQPAYIHRLDPAEVDRYLAMRPKIVLTDQYAPVDNLMSGVFRRRSQGN